MEAKVQVFPLQEVGSNSKGFTYAYQEHINNRGMLAAFRKAGTVSGNHFHKGYTIEKNPEILVFLSGQATLHCYDLNVSASQEEKWELNQPSVIFIYPWVWHSLKVHKDCHFIELNSMEAHEQDTFYSFNGNPKNN